MIRLRSFFGGICVALACTATQFSYARDLTFEQRVEAQRAIDRVYYNHQIGATRPFSEVVPEPVLRQKVRTYLQESLALEQIWNTPVTQASLRREIERIARDTRDPGRLEEVYDALGHDPVLVQECFARPALVGRLVRSFLASDSQVQAGARAEAESLWRRLKEGAQHVSDPDPRRTVVEVRRSASDTNSPPTTAASPGPTGPNPAVIEIAPEEFEAQRTSLPGEIGEIGPVVENTAAFLVRVLLYERGDSIRVATYAIPKRPWDGAWNEMAPRFDPRQVVAVAAGTRPLPSSSTAPCLADNTWDHGILDDPPSPRSGHVSVWTGSVMIVWGGETVATGNTGHRYDPVTDTWQSISALNAPPAGSTYTAVWTGEEMIVWRGVGGRYNPITDTWTSMATLTPNPRQDHTAVWTGTRMIVWGGRSPGSLDDGGRYDPVTDSWQTTSLANAPSARFGHTAVWTGHRMIVWGGDGPSVRYPTAGGVYDPQADSWTTTSTVNVPTGRTGHRGVWTGTQMIVWGGRNPTYLDTGASYDPVQDSWASTTASDAPAARDQFTAEWTGTRMLVWGGQGVSSTLNTGGSYDPAADAWTAITTQNAPSARKGHTSVWTGARMIVWGGGLNLGGRYDPATDTWTPTSIPGPVGRSHHTIVWTGNTMIVWGGEYDSLRYLGDGSAYDPLLDEWQPLPAANAPEPRAWHAAVWDGESMLVWGGLRDGGSCEPMAGGRYDPITETWRPISNAGAPSTCIQTAVWTRREMVIWSGNQGGRYDPLADRWMPVATAGAPSNRLGFIAVWTGQVMVIWGGVSGSTYPPVGGRYDPVTDTWSPTNASVFIAGRRDPGVAWTGTEMIVWGGYDGAPLASGGRYNPISDTWTGTALQNAPSARTRPTVTWTGEQAVVLGGNAVSSCCPASGGLYDPSTNAWLPTSTTNAPPGRDYHTAAWSGSYVIVWGGLVEGKPSNDGGRYAVGHAVDNDGDGFAECAGDCNDDDASVHPAAVDVCDGRDNDCDGTADDGFGDADGDGHGDACDCASDDATAFSVPFEVLGVSWAAVATLQWNSGGSSGSATRFDVLRGRVSEWPVGSGASEVCLESGLSDAMSSESETPALGEAYYYLVRGHNACGPGSYGRSSSGMERVSSTCP